MVTVTRLELSRLYYTQSETERISMRNNSHPLQKLNVTKVTAHGWDYTSKYKQDADIPLRDSRH
jgi:hypothetical protein